MDKSDDGGKQCSAERTARVAVLAGAPGLMLTSVAALTAESLALDADLILTILDMLVLLTVWAIAHCGRDRRNNMRRAESLVATFVGAGMVLSMALVAWTAVHRIADGGLAPSGPGVAVGLALNAGYLAVNAWILYRWRLRYLEQPSAFIRSQVCLYWDKLSANLILVVSLTAGTAFADQPWGSYVDPLAGLLMAAATLRWVSPILLDAARGLWIGRGKESSAAG